jgi:hypothetical protein
MLTTRLGRSFNCSPRTYISLGFVVLACFRLGPRRSLSAGTRTLAALDDFIDSAALNHQKLTQSQPGGVSGLKFRQFQVAIDIFGINNTERFTACNCGRSADPFSSASSPTPPRFNEQIRPLLDHLRRSVIH